MHQRKKENFRALVFVVLQQVDQKQTHSWKKEELKSTKTKSRSMEIMARSCMSSYVVIVRNRTTVIDRKGIR